MADSTSKLSLALIEDNEKHAMAIQSTLIDNGYQCTSFPRSKEFQIACQTSQFDAILLDWHLGSNECGLDTVKWLRRECKQSTPILLITSRSDEEAVVQALADGADDFMSKPIKAHELLARVEALIRRSRNFQREIVKEHYPYRLDITRKSIRYHGNPIALREKEFELAAYLFANPDRVLSRDELLTAIWGTQESIRTVDTHVSRVRKKLSLVGNSYWKVTCVYQKGYRMQKLTSGIPSGAISFASHQIPR